MTVKDDFERYMIEKEVAEQEKQEMVRINGMIKQEEKRRLDYIAKQMELPVSEVLRMILNSSIPEIEKALNLKLFQEDEEGNPLKDENENLIPSDYGKVVYGTEEQQIR